MCSVIYDCYLAEWRILKNLKFSFAIYPNDILLKHGAANPIMGGASTIIEFQAQSQNKQSDWSGYGRTNICNIVGVSYKE